jgi:hypothetical protein
LPGAWTDIDGPDPFLALSAGRSYFRVDDLLQMVVSLRGIEVAGVNEITP